MSWTGCVGIAATRTETRPAARGTRRRRLDRRGRIVLALAATTAVLVNAGVAWMYWRLDGGAGGATTGSVAELQVRARSDESLPLRPGGATSLTVTVTNRHAFPVRIVAVRQAAGQVTVDALHRDAGCVATGVAVVTDPLPVSWKVPRNAIGVFTVPDALRMTEAADPACRGAVFTVPVRATGIGGSS
ncbi:hypothetical protein [Actinoplanes sp. NPDC049599]|uniref:hypothetical protein n=1 Tax=Actinoplanes sp. NPDC049599 TaxID=3363903 RepID=UPI0037A4C2AE